jgi:hypothetical protein
MKMNLLKTLLCSAVYGVTAEAEMNTRKASDGRHPPFITSFALPAAHPAWPEGTVMAEGANPGEAKANVLGDFSNLLGVLETRVGENEQSGNIMLHGSCPADILHQFDGAEVPVADGIIKALRGIGIYV